MRNIFTIDIEGWYQSSLDILGPKHADVQRPVSPDRRVVINTRRLLHILSEYGMSTTCFILGTVTETYPELVCEIRDAGHEIATHGYGHELVYKLTPEKFRIDLQRSLGLLENLTKESVRGYRAPYFSITHKSEWALEVLAELGIEYDSSIFPIYRKLYGYSGWERFPHIIHTAAGDLRELPISTISLLGQTFPVIGGGYFRLLPYPLIQWVISGINQQGQPVVFYIHPYELDTDELRYPLLNETLKTRFVRLNQRLNRGKVEVKLRRLLDDFNWISVRKWISEHK